jgi:hypothetical protein
VCPRKTSPIWKLSGTRIRKDIRRLTVSQPCIRLPDDAHTEISFLWQTGLRLHFRPQPEAMWQLMKQNGLQRKSVKKLEMQVRLMAKALRRFIHHTMQPRTRPRSIQQFVNNLLIGQLTRTSCDVGSSFVLTLAPPASVRSFVPLRMGDASLTRLLAPRLRRARSSMTVSKRVRHFHPQGIRDPVYFHYHYNIPLYEFLE